MQENHPKSGKLPKFRKITQIQENHYNLGISQILQNHPYSGRSTNQCQEITQVSRYSVWITHGSWWHPEVSPGSTWAFIPVLWGCMKNCWWFAEIPDVRRHFHRFWNSQGVGHWAFLKYVKYMSNQYTVPKTCKLDKVREGCTSSQKKGKSMAVWLILHRGSIL